MDTKKEVKQEGAPLHVTINDRIGAAVARFKETREQAWTQPVYLFINAQNISLFASESRPQGTGWDYSIHQAIMSGEWGHLHVLGMYVCIWESEKIMVTSSVGVA